MQVHDVMTHPASVINPNASVCEVAKQMRADNIGALPVGENGRLIGMVTDRDIVIRAVAAERPVDDTTAREVMSGDIFYCFEDDDIEQAARIMAEHQVRRLPVLDRDEKLVGVVALGDLGRQGGEAAQMALAGVSQPSRAPRR